MSGKEDYPGTPTQLLRPKRERKVQSYADLADLSDLDSPKRKYARPAVRTVDTADDMSPHYPRIPGWHGYTSSDLKQPKLKRPNHSAKEVKSLDTHYIPGLSWPGLQPPPDCERREAEIRARLYGDQESDDAIKKEASNASFKLIQGSDTQPNVSEVKSSNVDVPNETLSEPNKTTTEDEHLQTQSESLCEKRNEISNEMIDNEMLERVTGEIESKFSDVTNLYLCPFIFEDCRAITNIQVGFIFRQYHLLDSLVMVNSVILKEIVKI